MKRSPCSSPDEPVVKTSRGSKYYKQAYRKEWESMPDFKGWLTEVAGHPQRAYCIVCAKSLHAHRLSLLKHTVTLKHTTAALRNYTHTNADQHYEHETSSTLSSPETSSTPVSTVPTIPFNKPKASLTMKVPTKQNVTASDKSMKEERTEPVKKSSDMIPEESNCEENDIDHSSKITVSDDSDEETNIEDGAAKSLTLHGASEDKNVSHSVEYSEPVAPPPPLVTQDVLVPKVVKPILEYPISTHVLDTAKGAPVGNLHVSLYKLVDGRWTAVGEGVTTPDGRCNSFIKRNDFLSGRYKLHFDVDRYFEIRKQDSLYPFIEIVFDARSSMEHYHVPLLLSPFGYTTYRGS